MSLTNFCARTRTYKSASSSSRSSFLGTKERSSLASMNDTRLRTKTKSHTPKGNGKIMDRIQSSSSRKAKLTTSIISKTIEECRKDIDEAVEKKADIIELRVDFLEQKLRDDENLMKEAIEVLVAYCEREKNVPAIVTFRPIWEGGEHDGDEEVRLRCLWHAFECGATYVDCELLAIERFERAKQSSTTYEKKPTQMLICSTHDYEKTPELDTLFMEKYEKIRANKLCDIAKIACVCTDINDVARLKKVLEKAARDDYPCACLGMSEHGVISRFLASKYGSYLTFGSIRAGFESAPGQPTLEDLTNLYRVNTKQTKETKVLGVMGNPIAQSKSPQLHNKALITANVDDKCYVPLLVKDFEKFVNNKDLFQEDWVGFSVTIPHKEAALKFCGNNVDPVAAQIGAVNTLVREPNGSFRGYNTDYVAAIGAIEKALDPTIPQDAAETNSTILAGKTILVLGAGGAARGLAFGAKFKNANVVIANRSKERADALAEACGGVALSVEDVANGNFGDLKIDIIANTTSLGMVGDRVDDTPVPKKAIEKSGATVCFDAVYNPLETRLLREAKECGLKIASGLDMFVGQAARQFELFNDGKKADYKGMRETVLNASSSSKK
jgi:3-dehydroquinate dehydratase / shikimate dehydrogenase